MDNLFDLDDKSNDGEDEENEKRIPSRKTGLVMLIDCSSRMFRSGGDSVCPFQKAIQIALRTYKRKIIAGGKQMLSVVFYNTQKARNNIRHKGVFVLEELDEPTRNSISSLKAINGDKNTAEKFLGKIYETKTSCLVSALWVASYMFTDRKFSVYDDQRIWLFSNSEDPSNGDEEIREGIIQRHKDLCSINQTVIVWPLLLSPQEKSHFSFEIFYRGFFKPAIANDDAAFEERFAWIYCNSDLDVEMELVRQKEFAKRRYAQLPLILTENIVIGVELFSLISNPVKMPTPVKVDSQSGLPLNSETRWIDKETGDYVTPDQLVKCTIYGKEMVFITDEERKAFYQLDDPCIRMLGFKKISELKVWHNLRAPVFAIPSDERIKGSSCLFSALILSMIEKGRMMIASFVGKKSATPYVLALLPQLEVRDENEHVHIPAGLQMLFLPYRENVRDLILTPIVETNESAVEGIRLAENVINTIHFNEVENEGYNPLDYRNPAIQKHYMNLEILGLGYQENQEVWTDEDDDFRFHVIGNSEDEIQENIQKHSEVLGPFVDYYGGLDEIVKTPSIRSKRKAERTKQNTSKKELSEIKNEWCYQLFKQGKLNNLKVAELKTFCRENDLSTKGRKFELITTIEHFMKNLSETMNN